MNCSLKGLIYWTKDVVRRNRKKHLELVYSLSKLTISALAEKDYIYTFTTINRSTSKPGPNVTVVPNRANDIHDINNDAVFVDVKLINYKWDGVANNAWDITGNNTVYTDTPYDLMDLVDVIKPDNKNIFGYPVNIEVF